MLKLPRRLPKKKPTKLRKNTKTRLSQIPPRTTTFFLTARTKLLWIHFEALRIKLARTLTASRRITRRTWFKQLKKKQQQQQHKAPNAQLQQKTKKNPIWYAGFPHLAYRAKSRGSRMGRGSGPIKSWYFVGQRGHPLLQIRHSNKQRLAELTRKIHALFPGTLCCRTPKKSYWWTEWTTGSSSYLIQICPAKHQHLWWIFPTKIHINSEFDAYFF